MRRAAVVAILVGALVSAVGAETVVKAVRGSTLPHGSITVEEVDSVVVEAERLDSASIASKPSNKPTQDFAYAMH